MHKPSKAAIAQQITTIIGLHTENIVLSYQAVITLLWQSNYVSSLNIGNYQYILLL